MESVDLKLIIRNRIEKLTLSSGIPSSVERFHQIVKNTFGLIEDFDFDFDNDFGNYFTMHSTSQVKPKGTIKVVIIPSVVLTLTTQNDVNVNDCIPASENETDSNVVDMSSASATAVQPHTQMVDLSSRDTDMAPPHESPHKALWPSHIEIPLFSVATEVMLKTAIEKIMKYGTLMNSNRIKSDIMGHLADYIYTYTAYPKGYIIAEVAEALVKKHPCLRDPGGHKGWEGWQ